MKKETTGFPEIQPVNQTKNRWTWVRRFVVSLVLVAVAMHCLAPARLSQLWVERSSRGDKKSHIVLQTGFPSLDNLTGLAIHSDAAAIAFSPRPLKRDQGLLSSFGDDEGWWDRIFHRGHVHLANVQLPVLSKQLRSVEAVLSICTTTHDRFWQNVPDSMHCIASTQTKVDPEDLTENEEEPLFGVIQWTPDSVIVLKKRQIYWLVVQSAATPGFDWAFTQDGPDPWGSAQQTSDDDWKLFSKQDPVLSAMVTVVEH
ncbi:hypothetical protein DFQ28_008464 [Apophysomyces sp. BC1034]|nr:hypothetical protein DFQ30_008161 [Apophysomyces sp. BC1015]KAG0175461.1 hypothetical protein DFQ29_007133 [Apophysomyces sp. BC1021]KAG0185997.1 hypothetical protein DFQ28_008464 [Apophysomyces sp. BC1034]